MRKECIYAMLRFTKRLSSTVYRFDIGWVHPPPADPWRHLQLETVDNDSYRNRLMADGGPDGFKKALVRDLEARRNRYCRDILADAPPVYATSVG
jgi:hypothetical protein